MKRILFLFCTLALAGATRANSPGETLTAQQISDQATAESKSLQVVERQTDGRVRMTAPMQAMEALIGPDGLELRSVDTGGEAAFGWRLEAVGRVGRLHTLENTRKVVIEGERVAVLRSQAIEEFTASADGIRQDFIIQRPPQGGDGELLLELAATGVHLENPPDNDQAVTLRMADGRELHYHALRVTDVNGQGLPARMGAHTDTRLRIVVDDSHARYPVRVDPTFSDADWTAIIGPDFNGYVYASMLGGGDFYIGGSFSISPSGPVNNVARWDGNVWTALEGGVNDTVRALAWDAVNSHLYVGGEFDSAGGNSASFIARWDGTAWSPLGGGTGGDVKALAWDAVNGHLYIGGLFYSADGISAHNIARWDGATWSALGSGTGGSGLAYVSALAWDAVNGHLYAGGRFTIAGGANANRIARWDGAVWSPLGTGTSGIVSALAWDAASGHLYAGGGFYVRW